MECLAYQILHYGSHLLGVSWKAIIHLDGPTSENIPSKSFMTLGSHVQKAP